MAIRFLRQWSGYDDQAVVSLSASEEYRLVSAGIATFKIYPDLSDIDNFFNKNVEKNKGLAGVKACSSPSNNTGTTSFTFCMSMQLPYEFYAVRPFVYNGNAAATTGAACSVASAVSNAASFTPAGGSLIAVPLASAATFTIPAATSGAGTSSQVPSITRLDLVDIQSAARTDGGAGSILTARLSNPAGQVDVRAPGYAGSNGLIKTGYITGENTLNAGSSVTPFSAGPCLGFEVYSKKSIVTIVIGGDSITAGQGYEANNNSTSAPVVAVNSINALNASTSLALINGGIGNELTDAFYLNLLAFINNIPSIDVAFFSVGSPNDTDRYTQAWVSRMWRYVNDLIVLCNLKGIALILGSTCPQSGANATQKENQSAFYSDLYQFCSAANIRFADRYAFYNDGAGSFKSGLSDDGLHPNKTGIDGEAVAVFQPLFLDFI